MKMNMKNTFWILLVAALILVRVGPELYKGIKHQYANKFENHTDIAVIEISEELTDSSSYVHNIKEQFEDPNIKAIVLKMNCPGGCAGTAQAVFQEIKELKKQYTKPIITFIENLCASGGYYIACATDTIICTPAAAVGSIGALIAFPQIKEFVEQYKIKYHQVKSGAYKTVLSPFEDLSTDKRAYLQAISDDVYKQFLFDVVTSRPQLSMANHTIWAEGRIFTGRQAQVLGLVDLCGSQSAVEKVIRQKVTVEGKINWLKVKEKKNFWHKLINGSQDDEDDLTLSVCIDRLAAKIGTYVHMHGVQL
jgi:protease-4